MRDLTKKQLADRLAKYGFVSTGFLGYYNLPKPFDHISISAMNAGDNRRRQIAYLMMEYEKAKAVTT